jgi:hypothetical protein
VILKNNARESYREGKLRVIKKDSSKVIEKDK